MRKEQILKINIMAKNPSQLGANAIWNGPSKPTNLVPGNARYGSNCMKVSQAPLPYKAGPIASRAQANDGGSLGSHMASKYINPTAK
tara:strand:+ start:637 stop:897 length:261 start_codon:yes stop_codon:yes gene_type:complete